MGSRPSGVEDASRLRVPLLDLPVVDFLLLLPAEPELPLPDLSEPDLELTVLLLGRLDLELTDWVSFISTSATSSYKEKS